MMIKENPDLKEIANALGQIKSQLDVVSDQLVGLGLVYESELVQKVKEAADIVEYAEGLAQTRHLLTDESIDSPPQSAG